MQLRLGKVTKKYRTITTRLSVSEKHVWMTTGWPQLKWFSLIKHFSKDHAGKFSQNPDYKSKLFATEVWHEPSQLPRKLLILPSKKTQIAGVQQVFSEKNNFKDAMQVGRLRVSKSRSQIFAWNLSNEASWFFFAGSRHNGIQN